MTGTSATDTITLACNAQAEAKATMNRSAMGLVPPAPIPGTAAANLPTTNLNMGISVWNQFSPGSVTPVKGRRETTNIVPALVPTTAQLMPGRDGTTNQKTSSAYFQPYISYHLPTSPYISYHLPTSSNFSFLPSPFLVLGQTSAV